MNDLQNLVDTIVANYFKLNISAKDSIELAVKDLSPGEKEKVLSQFKRLVKES